MATHRLIIYQKNRRTWWDRNSEAECRQILTQALTSGIKNTSPSGIITIVPPWQFIKIEIRPIRPRRRRKTAAAADESHQAMLERHNMQ